MTNRCMPLGWLAPDGEFTECGAYDHFAVAREIIDRISSKDTLCRQPDDFLLQSGCVKISIGILFDHGQYGIWWERHLTDAQKTFLKAYFENPDITIMRMCKSEWEDEK